MNDDEPDWSGILASGRLPTATRAQRAAMERRQARAEARRKAEESARPAPVQLDLLDRPTPSAPARVRAADAPPTGTIAGVTFPRAEIRGTIGLLEYYRRFLRSDFERCRHPEDRFGVPMTKGMARDRLGFLVNVAVNRKAGIPDVACRKQTADYQAKLYRDCRGVRDAVNRRPGRVRAWGLNGKRWETDEVQARYGHLLGDRAMKATTAITMDDHDELMNSLSESRRLRAALVAAGREIEGVKRRLRVHLRAETVASDKEGTAIPLAKVGPATWRLWEDAFLGGQVVLARDEDGGRYLTTTIDGIKFGVPMGPPA